LRSIGVALHDAYLFDRHAEDIDRKLRIRCREALSHRLCSGDDFDSAIAIAIDGDGHCLLEHIGARPFEEGRDPAPAQLPAAPGVGRTRVESGPIG
jgi:hypothetical protein